MTAPLAVLQQHSMFSAALHSLAHVEGEVDVLLLGEQQNEKVIARLTLFDGRIQTDLWRHNKKVSTVRTCAQTQLGRLEKSIREVKLPQRTSVSDPCGAAGRAGERWCRGSCSQRSYREGEGRLGRYGCRT